MKIGIIYYSMTGRNDRLSSLVAEKLNIERTKVVETKPRKVMTVAGDLMFNRIPKVEPSPEVLDKYDMVILFAPVWMGAAATPMRRFFKYIKKTGKSYAFISLSGGADESNPNLEKSIIKCAGREPEFLMDMHVAEVVKGEVSREVTQSYKLSDEEYWTFADRAVEALREVIGKK